MQLSLLIGKQIVTQAGKRLGYVTGVYLDRGRKRITALAAADEDEEEFFLSPRAVLSFGDAIIARDTRLSAPVGVPSPVGLAAFSDKGESLGTVGDLLLEEQTTMVLVKDGTRIFVPADCVLTEETAIVYPSPKHRPRRTQKSGPSPNKKAPEKSEATEKEAPLPEREAPDGSAVSSSQPTEFSSQSNPKDSEDTEERELSFRCNLLGRKVKKDVYGENGDILFPAGERITPETLSLARRHNKLLALTVNTLTNLA